MIVGDFVEDMEATVPFQGLQAFGFAVDAVCPGKKEGDICRTAVHDFEGDQTYTEKRGHNFPLNATFSEVNVDSYDALVVPGGRAPEYLSIDESVLELVKKFDAAKKPIAALCHGLLVLAAADVLRGKKCTAYPACKPSVVGAGAKWTDPEPITACFYDHNLVSGAAWPAHPEFLSLILMAMGAKVHNADKRILMICGDFMEDHEAYVVSQSLLALDYKVDSVCPGKKEGEACKTIVMDFEGDQTYTEKQGHNFSLTASFDKVDVSTYDAVYVPGGRSPEYLSINEEVLELLRQFDQKEKVLAAIGHGPLVLNAAGVLKGKKVTAYPTCRPALVLGGAQWEKSDDAAVCCTDGRLVSGPTYLAHPEFIQHLIKALGTTIEIGSKQ